MREPIPCPSTAVKAAAVRPEGRRMFVGNGFATVVFTVPPGVFEKLVLALLIGAEPGESAVISAGRKEMP